jgi:Uma2 family endonuclease
MLPLLTAEQFIEERFDLPDSGQWAELINGVPAFLQPPDLDHGNVILNLSKSLAAHVHSSGEGYACFELGLAVTRRPDTALFPAACYFLNGPRFAEADKQVTDLPPSLVIELASTNDRRVGMADRVTRYHKFGVPYVWVIDPNARSVHVCVRGERARPVADTEILRGDPPLRGFSVPVSDLFVEPDWWK